MSRLFEEILQLFFFLSRFYYAVAKGNKKIKIRTALSKFVNSIKKRKEIRISDSREKEYSPPVGK